MLTKLEERIINNFDNILSDLVRKTMHQTLREYDIGPKEFLGLLQSAPDLERRYSLAMRHRADYLADEVIEIADTEIDTLRARIKCDSRKWYVSKLAPTKYGDRIALDVVHVDISGALTEARQRKERIIDAPHLLQGRFNDTTRVTQLTDNASAGRSHTPDLESVDTLDDILG